MSCFFQLSNRLGSAKCAADLVPPSAVARPAEQAIHIEGWTQFSQKETLMLIIMLLLHNQLILFIL